MRRRLKWGELLMAKVLISDQYLEDIAEAIREQNNTNNTYTPAQMAAAILALSTSSGGDFLLADNCGWGIASDNSAYAIPDEETLFGGS